MSLLNFSGESNYRQGEKKTLRLLFGIGALVGTIALGSTLAASINLNGGGPVEFGQGVTQTTACDDEITLTPYSTFVNADGAGSYKFSSLKVSGIDSSSDKCSGKTFVIKAYGDSGILNLVSYADTANPEDDGSYNYVEIANNGGEFTWVSGGSDGDDVIPGPDGYITETSFTLSFTSDLGTITRTPLASAEEVKRITIESSSSAESPESVVAVTWDDQYATTPSSGGSATYAPGSAVATIPSSDPVRDGFSFGGWWTETDGNGTQVTNGSYTPASPYNAITFYAKWIEDNPGGGGGTPYSVSASSLSGSNTESVSSGYSSSETRRTVSLTRSGDGASQPSVVPEIYLDIRSTFYATDVWSITNVTDMWGPNDYGPWGELSYYVMALTRDGNASFDLELKPNLPAGEYLITIKSQIDGNETTLLTYTVTVN